MVRPVVRLSPLGKAGATVVLAGVALAVWAHRAEAAWAVPASRVTMILGFVLYAVARVRSVTGSRKPPRGPA